MSTVDFAAGVAITQMGLLDHKVMYYHPTIAPTDPRIPDKQVWDLTPLVQSIRWSDDMNQAATEINIQLSHHDWLKSLIKSGGILTVFGPCPDPNGGIVDDEIVRGVVFEKTAKSVTNTSAMTITAYDHMMYYVKSEASEVFKGMTASEIIKYICKKTAMPMGIIEDTQYKIPKLIFRKQTWYDMMIIALSESRWVDGQRFVIRMHKGALSVYKKILPPKVWWFEYGKNVYNASLTESISNMKNKVIMYSSKTADEFADAVAAEIGSGTNDTPVIVAGGDDDPIEDADKIRDYGLMQHIETGGSIPERFVDEKEYGQHLLETLSRVTIGGMVDVPNINTLRWGDAIYIYEPLSGLAAQFYVQAAVHTITPNNAHMELTIQFEDLLPEALFEQSDGSTSGSAWDDILASEGITSRKKRVLGEYTVPLDNPYNITQEYGANKSNGINSDKGHSGIDMANGHGSDALNKPVYAARDGSVTYAAFDTTGGNMIKIKHADGIETWYAHLNVFRAKVGQVLEQGTLIGLVGMTGSAQISAANPAGGPHLHFQVLRNGVTVDPREYVAAIHA